MGVVIRQSIQNTLSTYLGFGLGAVNTLFLYTRILSVESYGLLSILLSVATLLMPVFVFGLPNTLIKFFSTEETTKERALLNGFSLWFPLVFIVPAALVISFFNLEIAQSLSEKNAFVAPYVWHILFIGISMAYFEIGYAQARVVLKSAWGNFLKEVSHRMLITFLLLLLYFKLLDLSLFFYLLVGVYVIRALLMYVYVFRQCGHSFLIGIPRNIKTYLHYSLYMFIGGTAAVVILEIDKIMIYTYVNIEQVAFYTVAVFMATIVGVPSRSMFQITAPLTARLIQEGDFEGLKKLYKQSSLHLGMVSGGVLLLLMVNLDQIYRLIPQAYGGTSLLVLLIGLSKFYDALLGNNNAILFNSPYFKSILKFGLFLAAMTVVLNYLFIPIFGIKGAAFASFLSVGLYDTAKIWYVKAKYHTQPFGRKTLYLLLILAGVYGLAILLPNLSNLYIDVVYKSVVISVLYVLLLYLTKTSEVLNGLIKKYTGF
jgi:O-antigen/teichoic acid export membrane protein